MKNKLKTNKKLKLLGPFIIAIGVTLILNFILKSSVTSVSPTVLIFGILILLIGITINIKSNKKEN
ncbi:hypothetical protein A500_19339 [Clostridium sartagoforme AAU1]|jgi:phosphate starvation-inducible membrane PsiE|uniref:Uncharacterized protein n=1 Tax=Clostridium sartagoforme AAU1 TaxID=1202534 RepID=R9BS24_9CLOT|nr:hypothetical protein [Clostridium sartagoforme]EOR19944.1 hypothetical protein A500_19339 [Clostridium sartagoforme AAU1]